MSILLLLPGRLCHLQSQAHYFLHLRLLQHTPSLTKVSSLQELPLTVLTKAYHQQLWRHINIAHVYAASAHHCAAQERTGNGVGARNAQVCYA